MRPFTSIVTNAQQTLLFVAVVVVVVVPIVCYCVYVGVRYMWCVIYVFEKQRQADSQTADTTREVQILEIRFLACFSSLFTFPPNLLSLFPPFVSLYTFLVPPCSPLQPVLKVLPV